MNNFARPNLANDQLPPASLSDAGKALVLDENAVPKWGDVDALPPVETTDYGKYLHADDTTGEMEWSEASGGYFAVNVIPTYNSSVQVTGATVDKTYTEILAAINAGTPVLVMQRPSATGNVVNIGTAESTFSMTYYSNVIIMHIPSFDYDVVLRQNNQVYLATPSGGLPDVAATDNGKVLTVVDGNWSANSPSVSLWWDVITNEVSSWGGTTVADFVNLPNGTRVEITAVYYDTYNYRTYTYPTIGYGFLVNNQSGTPMFDQCILDCEAIYAYGTSDIRSLKLHIDFLSSQNTTYSYVAFTSGVVVPQLYLNNGSLTTTATTAFAIAAGDVKVINFIWPEYVNNAYTDHYFDVVSIAHNGGLSVTQCEITIKDRATGELWSTGTMTTDGFPLFSQVTP